MKLLKQFHDISGTKNYELSKEAKFKLNFDNFSQEAMSM